MLMSYPEIVSPPLQTYAPYENIEDREMEIVVLTQAPDKTSLEFAK